MTRTLTLALLFGLSALAGCGGKDKPASTTTATGAATGKQGDGDVHEGLPPEMKAFHDVLKPRWHAEQGPQRIAQTCSAVAEFKTAADAIAVATPPITANADTWTTGTRALVAAVAELEPACASNDAATIEAAFAKIHDAFHALMTQGKFHGEGMHGEGMHGGGMHGGGMHGGSAGSASAGSAASGHEHGGHQH